MRILPSSTIWPVALNQLQQPPDQLFYEGNLDLLHEPAVAVIGARACTRYGRDQARKIARAVSQRGVVVSGLAAGIDCEGHLAAGGRTVAVLGQGLRSPMPEWQIRVRRRILAMGGLVVSELEPDIHATRWTFPARNRIVAALARVVVVVEAGARSGTQITVGYALSLNREVLAVPGPVGAPASVGCLKLISEGAGIVVDPAWVVEVAGL